MKDNQAKYPQLRFKGFTDPWEQRKLGKMGYTFTGLSGKTKEDFGHGNAKFVTYMNVFSSPVSNSEMVENVEVDSKQHQVEYGDVFFTTSSETPQEVGMSSVWLETAENIYLNSFCFGYHPMVEFDPYYLAFMLRSPVIRKKFMLLAQGISRYNISKNKVMEMLVPVPEIVEQQKIGAFFQSIDDTIALHQRKLDLLKEQKKGYLQKMFPKNGAKVPELRFARFADAWEQRKLTEIVNRVNKSSNSDVLPKVEFEDIVSGEGRLNKDISSKLDSRKGTLFESENILYGKLRPYLKNWLFPDFEGVALGDFWVFEATDVSVPSFDYYLIQSDDYQKVANDTSGTKMPRSDWKNVSSTDFAIPSKDEQKQIGAFFKQLDDTITLHQRKLDLLKEQKKGFLQKMFV